MERGAQGPGFVHLHVHSSYSLLEGALSIAALAKLAKADHMPALALTDTNNLFGALEFSEKIAGSGIQPIVGIELSLAFEGRLAGRSRSNPALELRRPGLVLLAASEAGYGNLMALSSKAFLEVPAREGPFVTLEWLSAHAEGLIALTGGPIGPVDAALAQGQPELARDRLKALAGVFGDRLYVEIQRHGLSDERRIEPALLDLADDLNLPVAATNNVYFGTGDDFEAHDCLLAIAEGKLVEEEQRRRLSPEFRFTTRAEAARLFEDLPDALTNTVEIARRCAYRPRTMKPILPRFAAGADDAAEAGELRRMAEAGLAARLSASGLAPGMTREDYELRLRFELSIIERMRYPGYFLIVADFIRWAKAQGIPVGPGRGSGAGSLAAYALTITDVDPLRFGLLFERFLNPERVSMPDFDIDFCQERRDEVIAYVRARYGGDRVAQIITFGTLLARGVMRDVGRVMGLRYGDVDRLTKLVPVNPAKPVTLAEAIREEAQFAVAASENETIRRMLAVAQKLEGLYRHASTHAAGIVIGDRPLSELVPLYRDPRSDMPVTQFNMKWVEPAGLVKFDFLGLKTLTVLQGAVDLLRQRGVQLDLSAIPLDDPGAYALLSRGETVGVFQVESGGMRRALIEMRPDRLEDIIALVALYRPGPMANIPVYCDVKHGRTDADYYHPRLEPILKETFGVIVYQEQVMQIAQALSGYSLGEADLLRRAMGKKIKAEMDAQRERFVTGCCARGLAESEASTIFDLLAKFADYGFNKSHAAAYALIAYQTAYMKANYPVEFLAASMSQELTNTDKLNEFRREAQRLKIAVLPPDVCRSGVRFEVDNGAICYALAAVKGVGTEAARALVSARGDKPFRNLADLARRLDPRLVNKRCLESLAGAGAFDRLAPDRARLIAGLDLVQAHAAAALERAASGQNLLFAESEDEDLALPAADPFSAVELLRREHSSVGFFLSGHPLDGYADALARMQVPVFEDFLRQVRQGATFGRLAVTVLSRAEKRTKNGNRMAILGLSDRSAQFEATLFSELLQASRAVLEPGTALLITVAAAMEGEDLRLRIQELEPLDAAVARVQRGLRLFLRGEAAIGPVAEKLGRRGDGEIVVTLMLDGGGEVDLRLPGRFDVSPAIGSALKTIAGVVAVQPV